MTEPRFRPHRSAITAAAAILFAAAANCVPADLVLVQKVEGGPRAGEMTMKIKGDRARADISPALSTIIDASTGDVTALMHDRKTFMRISAAAAKELAARMKRTEHETSGNQPTRPILQPTGNMEKLLSYDTQEFVWEFGDVRFTYWIAKDFPNTESILAVMKSMQTGAALFASGFTPDPAEFRGLPLKTEMAVAGKKSFTATVVSVKEEPVDGAVFEVPGEYREMPPAALPALSR